MTKIYYFSGTGNTYWSAKKLAGLIGDAAIFSISREIQQPEICIEADAAVFLFPAYAYGIPGMVSRFLKKADIRADYLAAAVTYGTSQGGALADVRRILAKKTLTLNYAALIPSVENYIPIFGVQEKRVQDKRIAMQTAATAQTAQAIIARESNSISTFRPISKMISALFLFARPLLVRGFRLTAACTACGLCARVCPSGAIRMTVEGPVFQKNCEQCQACLNFCPSRAISYKRLKPDTERYHHPEVTVGEMGGD
ncbi:putative 4Fe-4S ferredoxin, iron-sulfur binding domain protein [Treponema primitia ZAS-2]|uniref:Putative 4Fe-4S ferredoxin, iron-sulfur binding domain protein n=1 Tax=Treponema primitia (strain ATCC BAA-887 / DSM 12427 / ZAS-2) TaxID=545694 RepID=F5YHR2_TREPZ|nr:EFR1 family ferrodoxin [Treponema primitia]AEF85325.1 putative 4Fe-4S ferredoxin, iron-sulfur binding domain protein [Treponema primitia ZAS-2]